MTDRCQCELRAAPLPRVGLGLDRARRAPLTPLAPGPESPRRLAARLLRRLDDRSRGTLPFELGPSGQWGLWVVQLLAATALGLVALAWMRSPWGWGLLVPALMLAHRGAALLRHQDIHRRALALHEHLAQAGRAADLEDELVHYMTLAPEDPAARYLFALSRLERSRPLEALLQLATLRDRYPAAGEVVLLAAIACTQLERPGQAGRLLAALEIEPQHPWWADVVRLAHACGSVGPAGSTGFVESGTPG